MRCKAAKKRMVLRLYAELTPRENEKLEKHLAVCPHCAEESGSLEKLSRLLQAVDGKNLPEADYEKSWEEIMERMRSSLPKRTSILSFPRLAYAVATLVIVLISGIVIGKFLLSPDARRSSGREWSTADFSYAVTDYFNNLKPLLIDYAHDSTTEKSPEMITMQKEMAKELIIENLLLKRVVLERDPSLASFLEDVDIILKEIAHSKEGNGKALAVIKDYIQERGILFRMRVLGKI